MGQIPINFSIIRQKLLYRMIIFGGIIGLSGSCLGEYSWLLSAILGTGFGYIIFTQLIVSQCNLLNTKRKDLFLLGYFYRLILYGIPTILTLVLKDYLNLYILLLFLLAFQLQYVVMEFSRNYKRYKRRLKNEGD
jgi:hypothetical protein